MKRSELRLGLPDEIANPNSSPKRRTPIQWEALLYPKSTSDKSKATSGTLKLKVTSRKIVRRESSQTNTPK